MFPLRSTSTRESVCCIEGLVQWSNLSRAAAFNKAFRRHFPVARERQKTFVIGVLGPHP